ncbi:Ger(x)C family spore germination protein [Fredinandcohnia sp. FSL W7-1320]|uniref:Ger(x)C family spore germination protein n=1 Tax=Fredinandcohnia sp. FSL W7-1320 TaxID=2954540 RepID=UPI0030FD4A5F
MAKLMKLSGILCILLSVTGCWDRVEIEERGFVIGAAIDTTEENPDDSFENLPNNARKENYKLTYQYVVPASIQGSGGGQSEGGSAGGSPFFNVSSEGKTIFQITRQLSTQVGRSPYLQHVKIIVLSEELSKQGYLYDALDFFVRDHEMRRVAKVMVTNGKAIDALQVDPKNEPMPIMFLESITQNTVKTAKMLPPTNLGDVHENLLIGTSFVIPRLVVDNKNAAISGAAVFDSQDQKLVGTLNDKETIGLNFILGDIEGGVLEFLMKDQYFAVEVKQAKTKIVTNALDKNQMKFSIEINSEGNIGESYGNLNLLEPKVLAEIEKKAEQEIELIVNQVIEKLQKEYKVDVIRLGEHLKQDHYQVWESVKDDWDKGENYFSNSVIDLKVNFTLREIGSSVETVQ